MGRGPLGGKESSGVCTRGGSLSIEAVGAWFSSRADNPTTLKGPHLEAFCNPKFKNLTILFSSHGELAIVSSPPPFPTHFGYVAALCSNPTSPQALTGRWCARARWPLFRAAAEGGNGLRQDDDNSRNNNGGGSVDPKRDRQRPAPFNFRWRDLLSIDPDNVLAVALTGLLTWASVQVLFQLFFISVAIVLAALKYSFIAALLLFILITLL